VVQRVLHFDSFHGSLLGSVANAVESVPRQAIPKDCGYVHQAGIFHGLLIEVYCCLSTLEAGIEVVE